MSRQSVNVINWRKRTKQKIIESMGKCCQICGYFKCEAALELHHLDPSIKEISFASIRANPVSAEKIKQELLNCILLCANCHREVHNKASQLPENFAKFDPNIFDTWQLEKKQKKTKIIKEKISQQKIFLSNDELISKLKNEFANNNSALARHLGVSETAIRKKLKKASV
jgi:5-methylcytosine-specific restriction endonuclease McrA